MTVTIPETPGIIGGYAIIPANVGGASAPNIKYGQIETWIGINNQTGLTASLGISQFRINDTLNSSETILVLNTSGSLTDQTWIVSRAVSDYNGIRNPAISHNGLGWTAECLIAPQPVTSIDSGIYGRRLIFNTADYLGTDGSADVGLAINRAIQAAASGTVKGQVVLHNFNLPLSTSVLPVSGVDVLGSGWGKSVIRPQGVHPAFQAIVADGQSSGNPLTNLLMADFEIDGSQQSGSYASSIKGLYLAYMLRCKFNHIYIHDTGATGFGCDYFIDSSVEDILTDNCGRLGISTSFGAAGIGIGVSSAFTNNLDVINCTAKNSKRANIFFETQDGTLGGNVALLNPTSVNAGDYGIGDAGCQGLLISGGSSTGSGFSDFGVYSGTLKLGVGSDGHVRDLRTGSSVNNAVTLDATDFGINKYTLEGMQINSNGGHGIKFQTLGNFIQDVQIKHNSIQGAQNAGIAFTGTTTGAINRVTIQGNKMYNQGQAAGSVRSAVYVAWPVTDLKIIDNDMHDIQGSKTQDYGVNIVSGGSLLGNSLIQGNDMRGNLTGTLHNVGSISAATVIRDNPGYNPVGSAVPGTAFAIPASTVTWTNTTGVDGILYVSAAGTTTVVVVNGVNIPIGAFVAGQSFQIPVGGTITLTYSIAPTLTFVGF